VREAIGIGELDRLALLDPDLGNAELQLALIDDARRRRRDRGLSTDAERPLKIKAALTTL